MFGAEFGYDVMTFLRVGTMLVFIAAFAGIDGLLLLVAFAAVFVILVIVYRSPLLPVIVLGTSLTALCASVLAVVALARADVLVLNGQTQGILFILVIFNGEFAFLTGTRGHNRLLHSRLR